MRQEQEYILLLAIYYWNSQSILLLNYFKPMYNFYTPWKC